MIRTPTSIQRLLHRLFLLRPVTAFFASRVHRIDQFLWKLTGGRFSVTEILGWNIIELMTTGARTNRLRRTPLVGLFDGEKIALIATSFGRQHNPAWYYNLKACPKCAVRWKGKTGMYLAREAQGAEYDRYWEQAVACYEGYARYRERAWHRHIPVMVLEPKK